MTGVLLVAIDGGETLAFTERFAIGKREDCAVRLLADEYVSGIHAVCVPAGGRWEIRDCGAMNGTWLNGVKVHGPHPLAKGDRVMIGHTMITMVPA